VTEETGLSIVQADIRISKNGGAFDTTSDASPTTTHDSDGYYQIPLTTTDTNTLGELRVNVHKSGALPVWEDFMVVPAVVYDTLVLGTDDLNAQVAGMDAGVITAAAVATGAIDADALATDAVDEIVDAMHAIQFTPLFSTGLDASAATTRITISVQDLFGDLPTTGEITPGTISIARKPLGSDTWLGVVTDAAMSESAGQIYYDEQFQASDDYAAGDRIRLQFKSQSVTIGSRTYEWSDSTGMFWYGYIAPGAGATVLTTEISSVTSQSEFVLDAGAPEDDVYNGMTVIITDNVNGDRKAVGTVSDWAQSTLTLTLEADPGVFTIAAGDTVEILASLNVVASNAASALTDIGLDHLVSTSVTGTDVADDSIVAQLVSQNSPADWDDYNNQTMGLEYIAGQLGTNFVQFTSIGTVNSQTEFTLNAGSTIDDIYIGLTIQITDEGDSTAKSIHTITDYVGSTRTVTISSTPDFTVAANDTILIYAFPNHERVNLEADTALSDIGLDHLVNSAVTGTDIANNSIIAQLVSASATADWDDYDNTTDSLQAIRDRGDSAWTTGGGGSSPVLIQNTTIATLASQTSFTLTAGSADDDAYNGLLIVVTDQSTSTQKAIGQISDYTGSTRTVTLVADPGVFTMAVGDTVDVIAILSETAIRSEIDSNSTQLAAIVADTNELQGDWADGGRLDLILDARASQASVDIVDGIVDSILVDTGTTLDTKLNDIQGAGFSSSTDSLEAIRDRGDAAWITATSPVLLQTTTIATLATQTSFTLTAGSADDDAYNGYLIVVTDSATSTQKAVGEISDYTGSTRTVTLSADPGIFTMAVGDTVDIIAVPVMRGTDNANTTTPPTALAIADQVWDEAQTDHTTSGSFGEIASEIADILVDTGTTLDTKLDDIQGSGFSTSTDSLEAIRDRGDAAWTTGAGGSNPMVLQNTTIATLASQTNFTLTAGSADDDAYNGFYIIVTDQTTSTQKAIGS
jgi:hypothetical protein